MGNICRNYFEFGQVVLVMLLKKMCLALVAIFSAEWNHLCNFGKGNWREN